ncbi:MAG: NDP-hexose 2,3-dehydratase family protein, partial [Cyanobacteria bacterium P01_A01_bin.84]
GVSRSNVYLPSELVYPGEQKEVTLSPGEILIDLIQSEEGGRFMQNENRYQLIQVDEDIEIDDDHIWLGVAEFKTLLATSNMVSIQLRCIASFLLPTLNPLLWSKK